MFGIVSTGPSSLAIDLTYDRKRARRGHQEDHRQRASSRRTSSRAGGADGPPRCAIARTWRSRRRTTCCGNLEKITNRRKAVVWVSNGYDFNPFRRVAAGRGPGLRRPHGARRARKGSSSVQAFNQGAQFADADLARELAELTRTANRANATLYTIDPRGLVGGADLDEQVEPGGVRRTTCARRRTACASSPTETGGIAVVNQNDFDKALKRIDAETSDYYVLGYYSSNPDPLKRTRKVEVKVKNRPASM
jgi:VWFA-related protein